jgi:hypothetical protein
MTDEERQRTMDFILQQMAQVAVGIQRNEEERQRREQADTRRDVSVTQIRRILAGAIWESRRYRRDFNERMAALVNAQMRSDEARSHLDEKMNALIAAQLRTEEALRSLAATTERNSTDIATLARAGKTGGEVDGGSTTS